MSAETTKKKIKIDNGTEFARVYTDKEVDSKLSGLSSDTAIDLFYHQVEINNLTSSPVVTCYIEFYSSNNLPCDSLTDLKTILGNTFKKGAFGSTASGQCVVWITESAIFLNNQTNISLAGATFKDTVTTI